MPDPIVLQTLAVDFSNVLRGFLLVLFLAVSIGMILVVLIQRPQGGGLSGAFGASADGAGQTALGVKTGDALTTATIVIFVVFLLVAIWLNFEVRPATSAPQQQISAAPTTDDDPTDDGQPLEQNTDEPNPADETNADNTNQNDAPQPTQTDQPEPEETRPAPDNG